MRKLQTRLALFSILLLVSSTIFLSWLALRSFEEDLPPEMARTVTTVGYSASDVLEKAYVNGVPLHDMVGVDDFLSTILKDNPSISYLIVTDEKGQWLYHSGDTNLQLNQELVGAMRRHAVNISTEKAGGYFDTSIPLAFQHSRIGTLHLGQHVSLVEDRLNEITYDVVTVLVVASLIAFELMRFVLTFVIATPFAVTRDFLARIRNGHFTHYLPFDHLGGIGQLSAHFNRIVGDINGRYHALQARAHAQGTIVSEQIRIRMADFGFHAQGERNILHSAALDHIRWPFFLLIFADSLSLSFFPVFVGQFYSPDMGISKNMVIGLPISIFMFTWALSMPWAGMWSDRVGHRKAFIVGAVVTTIGLLLTAFAHSLYDLLLWRSITALGYGLVFITAQSYVTNNTPAAQRTRGMAVFLSSFFAGSLSGSAIGGILSDRLGYGHTIMLSAILSIMSAVFVLRFLRSNPSSTATQRKKLSLNDFKLLLQNKKFVAITFLAAVPAKVALTGFLYYSAPLYLKLLGNNQSTTGRVMMAYGLVIIILSPWIAKLADKMGNLRWFVSIGGYAAATSMFVIYSFDTTAGVLASITLLGLAHSIGVSPQLALINDFCKDVVQEVGSGTATGIFRLIERLGNVLGPIIAGFLISEFGFNHAFLGIGLISFVCTTCFTLMFFWFDREKTHAKSVTTVSV